ncbi:MAG: beta-galactosidase [Verrucomicrobiae bacterium]|nr:beta-galactosidase [Verrucomicrobiae bacterium]
MKTPAIFSGHVFPLGTHVYREPHQDQDELMADLPLLKKLGFNMIKIQECWCIDEPREGEIDLSRIERIIARARELGLGVYLGLTMEQAPAWLRRKFPDCFLVYANGLPHNDLTQYCLPADGKPGPCWDHPGARAAAGRFIAKLVRQLGRFENLWCWNTWQEIGFWPNNGGEPGFCYCPHTLARFREWLQSRHKSLDELNRAWQTGFGDWEEVEPPRRHGYVPSFIDWRYFMDDVYITRVLEWKTRIIKENDPYQRPVFSHVGAPQWPGGMDWRWARVADFYGKSNYPDWHHISSWDDATRRPISRSAGRYGQLWESLLMGTDFCRCAAGRERPFWGAEFQGGPISIGIEQQPDPSPENIRFWMLSALAGGVNGISFWNHRSEISWREANGFGLLDPRGDSTPRIEEAARIGRAIQTEAELFTLGRPPQADVAILINEDLYHFCQATEGNALQHLHHGIRGHYHRLFTMGIGADFIETEEVIRGGLAGYKAAILPVPLALDGGVFQHLRTFVRQGGLLISDACPGRHDRHGFCPRAQMVDGGEEVFGARHKKIRIVKEPNVQSVWTPREDRLGQWLPPMILKGTGPLAGARLRASFYLQTLEPVSAQPILKAGAEAVGTLNHFGKGLAALLGTFAGHSSLTHRLETSEGVFEKLLPMAGVKPDRCGRLLRRRRVHGNKQAWFLINPSDKAVIETIHMEGFLMAKDLLNDVVAKTTKSSFTVKIPPMNLGCVIATK